jgi:hypothetical protein
MLTKPAVIAMFLAGLMGCSSVGPPTTDIPATIASASGPTDHQKIADYFERKALAYDAEAAQHELLARTYMNRTRGDSASMMSHCRALRDQFVAAAKEARALSQEHRQAAARGEK